MCVEMPRKEQSHAIGSAQPRTGPRRSMPAEQRSHVPNREYPELLRTWFSLASDTEADDPRILLGATGPLAWLALALELGCVD